MGLQVWFPSLFHVYTDNFLFSGYRVAQIRVLFSIPDRFSRILFQDGVTIPPYLAYVEWFTPFTHAPLLGHRMYKVSRAFKNNERHSSVIPLDNIKRSVMLFPIFGPVAPREWTSDNVLELCTHFCRSFL